MSILNYLRKDDYIYLNFNQFKKISYDDNLAKIIQEPYYTADYDNWYEYNNELYYIKRRKDINIFLNELIGEEFSNYMSLPTIKYNVIEIDGVISGLASKNFKEPGKIYIKANGIYHILQAYTTKIFENKNDVSEDKRLFTFYLLRNYFSVIRDRSMNTYCIENLDKTFSIGPLFDYESEFQESSSLYYFDPMFKYGDILNPIHKNINELRKTNIFFDEGLKKLQDLDIRVLIDNVEKRHNIIIANMLKEHYEEFVSERKNVLKKNKVL